MDRARRYRPGGIAGLCRLLDEQAGAVEADLRHHFHADLGDLFAGRLTARQVITWVKHLPKDGAVAREQDEEGVEWGLTEQLLAALADRVEWGNYQRAGGKGQTPKPIPRPGVTGSDRQYGKTTLPPDEAKAILRGYREGAYDIEREVPAGVD